MGLVVNKNLGAMNAHRYLQVTESAFSKSVERLSSGMRINRAADDPAGLVISEKYRAQVDGLNQAIKNAKDGISLVQTAEGSLDEVTTVLRTMRNLALHAANTGASDSGAVQADQEQIERALETLNRIANTTAFGTRKLLNGSAGVSGTSDQGTVTFISGTVNTKAGIHVVDNLTASAKGSHMSNARTLIEEGNIGAIKIASNLLDGDATLTFGGASLNDKSISVSLSDNSNAATVKAAIEAAFADAGYTVTATVDFSGEDGNNGTIDIAGFNVLGADHNDAFNLTGKTGAAASATFARTTSATVTSSAKLGKDESLTFKDGEGNYVSVALKAGDTIGNAVSKINDALDSAGFNVTVSFNTTTKKFVVENDNYGDKTVQKYTVASNLVDGNSSSGTGLARSTASTDQYIADGAGGTAGANVTGDIGGQAATSVGGIYLVGASGTAVEGLKVKVDGGTTTAANITVTQNSLTFQVGAFENQTVKMAIADLRTNRLGSSATGTFTSHGLDGGVYLANIDVTTEEGAQDAIKVIDAALSEVSDTRSSLGSFQKDVLEATVRNLGVAAQNMAASESTIRDADMAEEMLNFSRAQILQQTGMAMLAQANQAPQMIMRLFG